MGLTRSPLIHTSHPIKSETKKQAYRKDAINVTRNSAAAIGASVLLVPLTGGLSILAVVPASIAMFDGMCTYFNHR